MQRTSGRPRSAKFTYPVLARCGSGLLHSFINRRIEWQNSVDLSSARTSETYEGDRMMLEKGYVKIIRGELELIDFQTDQLIAVIHLDKGQSMREIGTY